LSLWFLAHAQADLIAGSKTNQHHVVLGY